LILARLRSAFERLLESFLIFLMVALTVVVVVAVVYRKAGASLSWYDEVASIMLAWITYYGAALAALKRVHIGFDGVLRAMPRGWRMACVVLAEICVIGFFSVLAWTGWHVLQVLEGDTLVSLPGVSVQITQSVIPIGALLFILCEVLSLPAYWRDMRDGRGGEDDEAAS
jgi:TRAP-type C4-dicarboxylate transport system permease small subunit